MMPSTYRGAPQKTSVRMLRHVLALVGQAFATKRTSDIAINKKRERSGEF